MTDTGGPDPEAPTGEKAAAPGAVTNNEQVREPDQAQKSVEPTLLAYYGPKAPRVAAFVKAVRAAKLRKFPDENIAFARDHFTDFDPSLKRTVALARIGNSEPIVAWVHEAARTVLARMLPEEMQDSGLGAPALLDAAARGLAADLRNKNKQLRTRAQNVFSLTMVFLHDRRGLTPWQALKGLRVAVRGRAALDAAPSEKEAHDAVALATPSAWPLLATVAAIVETSLEAAEEGRAEALRKQAELERKVSELSEKNAALADRLQAAKEDIDRLRTAVATSEEARENEKHRRALETAELKGRSRGFLETRVLPLVADALDALEVEPPAQDVAGERLRSARKFIEGEVSWLGRPSE